MSANTYILIKQLDENSFRVSLEAAEEMVDAKGKKVGGTYEAYGITLTLEDAVRLANKHLEDSEYGLYIELLPK